MFLRRVFQKSVSLCMVSIQERVMMARVWYTEPFTRDNVIFLFVKTKAKTLTEIQPPIRDIKKLRSIFVQWSKFERPTRNSNLEWNANAILIKINCPSGQNEIKKL